MKKYLMRKGTEEYNKIIEEAKKERVCPFCGSGLFVGYFPAWQGFNFEGKKTCFNEPNTEASFESVECADCQEEIPRRMWEEWGL